MLVSSEEGINRYEITRSEYFVVERVTLPAGTVYAGRTEGETLEIWGTVEGESELTWAGGSVSLPTVRFCLVPARLGDFAVRAIQPTTMLRVFLP